MDGLFGAMKGIGAVSELFELRFRCIHSLLDFSKLETQLQESGRVRPRQGTEICNFGAPSPLDFFCFFSSIFLCNLVRRAP